MTIKDFDNAYILYLYKYLEPDYLDLELIISKGIVSSEKSKEVYENENLTKLVQKWNSPGLLDK